MKVSELRKLPRREWGDVKAYRTILVIASGRKHDSGYALMYIIGCDDENKPLEIAAACDDIQWLIPEKVDYDFRNDMFYPSGVLRYHSHKYDFQVGRSLSTTEVTLVTKK